MSFIPVQLGTAIAFAFGPVLNVDGTPYVTDNLVPADFLLYKNGTPAAPNASATIAHAGQGTFTVTLTTSDISAVGVATLALNKATLCAARVVLTVLPVAVYELLMTLTQTDVGYITAAFKKLFDVQTPLLVASAPMRGTDSANTVTPDAAGTLAALIGAKGGIPKLDATNGVKVVGFNGADATVPTVTTLTNAPTGMALEASVSDVQDEIDGVETKIDIYAVQNANGFTAGAKEATLTAIKGATWSASSDTLEHIRNATTGSGAGLPTATITIKNTNTGGAAVPGVTVYIYESTNTTKQAEGITNVSGIAAIITPGNATYKVRLYKAGWTQTTNPNTIVVSGDTPAEFYMTAFTPTPPSGTQTCTLYGTLRTANGADYAGQAVSARLDRAAWFDTEGAALSIQAVSTTTGADGYFELELARNATYLVTCAAHGVDDRAAVIGEVATLDYETAIAP